MERSGIIWPAQFAPLECVGIVTALAAWGLGLCCILTFALVGGGTSAPFDPPRRLMAQGPYRYLRNPMYLGAAVALCGAALFYLSLSKPSFAYAYGGLFLLATHMFAVWHTRAPVRC